MPEIMLVNARTAKRVFGDPELRREYGGFRRQLERDPIGDHNRPDGKKCIPTRPVIGVQRSGTHLLAVSRCGGCGTEMTRTSISGKWRGGSNVYPKRSI